MTREQIMFDNFMKHRGGIYIPESNAGQTYDIQFLLNRVVSIVSAQYLNIPPIIAGLIRSDSLNAAAGTDYDGNHYLGINVGAHMLLNLMFGKIFYSKNALPKLGDTSELTDEKQVLDLYMRQGIICFDLVSKKFLDGKIDPTRQQYRDTYFTFALEFLITHELGHILKGHTGYYTSTTHQNLFMEFDEEKKNGEIKSLDFQTLEMDADSFATNWAFNIGLALNKNVNKLNGVHHQIYEDFGNYLEHWVFSIYCFFRLCGFNEFDKQNVVNLDHPPPSERIFMIKSNLITLLQHHKIKDIENIASKLTAAHINADECFQMITYHESMVDVYRNNLKLAGNYVREVVHNWKNVYHLIKPFALIDLPPIQK